MTPLILNIAFEDSLSETVLLKIISESSRNYLIGKRYTRGGFGYLKKNIRGFNNASKFTPFVVITDLDTYECPPALLSDWFPFEKHINLLFIIAIKEIEAWLLAD